MTKQLSFRASFFLFSLIISNLASHPLAIADEGIFPFDALPLDRIQQQFGFRPTQDWINRVMHATIRMPGGSGAFVSADGLLVTNQHMILDALNDMQADKDNSDEKFLEQGFLAKRKGKEKKITLPNFYVKSLVKIVDVTAKVSKITDPDQRIQNLSTLATAAAAEKDAKTNGWVVDPVVLYSGGLYQLYYYKKYTDVRLVFSPENQIANFGGNTDNFNYPRTAGDFAFLRVYEKDKPASTPDFLAFSSGGLSDGSPVFLVGSPGQSNRNFNGDQLDFHRKLYIPYELDNFSLQVEELDSYAGKSAESAKFAEDALENAQNGQTLYKNRKGEITKAFVKERQQEEKSFQSILTSRATGAEDAKAFENATSSIKTAMESAHDDFIPYDLVENMSAFQGQGFQFARTAFRYYTESRKPEAERLPEYQDLSSAEATLKFRGEIHGGVEVALITAGLRLLKRYGSADLVSKVLGTKTPEDVANEAVNGTKLFDEKVREKFISDPEGANKDLATDPLYQLIVAMDGDARTYRATYEQQVTNVLQTAGPVIAQLRFHVYGRDIYPDATFTPRLSLGRMEDISQSECGAYTSMADCIQRSNDNFTNSKSPDASYDLPRSWKKQKDTLKLDNTPYNFVSTNDMVGGSSGSAAVDKNGKFVGVVFDGNIAVTYATYLYDENKMRAIAVDARGIRDLLDNVYHANALLKELGLGSSGGDSRSQDQEQQPKEETVPQDGKWHSTAPPGWH